MTSYRLTPAAEDDLFAIWQYIAADDPVAADNLENELFQAFERVTQRHDLGHFRRDLTDKEVRFLLVHGVYLVVYESTGEEIIILRILHGARDVRL